MAPAELLLDALPRLRAFALRRARRGLDRNVGDADDAFQESVLAVLEALHRYREDGRGFYRFARCQAISRLIRLDAEGTLVRVPYRTQTWRRKRGLTVRVPLVAQMTEPELVPDWRA